MATTPGRRPAPVASRSIASMPATVACRSSVRAHAARTASEAAAVRLTAVFTISRRLSMMKSDRPVSACSLARPTRLCIVSCASRAIPIAETLVERLHLYDSVVMVAADPERYRRRRIVDEHRAHVGVRRHQILNRTACPRIQAHDAIGAHRGGPDFAVLVE